MTPELRSAVVLAAGLFLGSGTGLRAQQGLAALSCENPDLNFELGEYPSQLNDVFADHEIPGVSEWYVYPGCDGGRVVADLIRIDKGHTEGLEENAVEQIVQLMMSVGR